MVFLLSSPLSIKGARTEQQWKMNVLTQVGEQCGQLDVNIDDWNLGDSQGRSSCDHMLVKVWTRTHFHPSNSVPVVVLSHILLSAYHPEN